MSKREQTEKRHKLFLKLWDERQEEQDGFKFVTCFESGQRLSRTTFRKNSACYHHVLEKSKFKELDLCEENIVILSPDIHALVHSNIDRTPKVKKLKEELYDKFSYLKK